VISSQLVLQATEIQNERGHIPSWVGPIPPVVITKSYFRTMERLAVILSWYSVAHGAA
jgi:hypothetical protein